MTENLKFLYFEKKPDNKKKETQKENEENSRSKRRMLKISRR